MVNRVVYVSEGGGVRERWDVMDGVHLYGALIRGSKRALK